MRKEIFRLSRSHRNGFSLWKSYGSEDEPLKYEEDAVIKENVSTLLGEQT
jgi:hypothetical protein